MRRLREMILTDTGRPKPMAVVVALAIVSTWLVYYFTPYILIGDSQSYVDAWLSRLSHGGLDIWRTPLLPLLVGLCDAASHTHCAELFVILQTLIWLSTFGPFRQLTKRYIRRRALQWTAMVIYAVYYPIAWFNVLLLTESIALSMVTVFLWLMMKLSERFTWPKFAALTLLLTAMVALRPSFLFFSALLLAIGIVGAFRREHRRKALMLCCSTILPFASTGVYAHYFEKEFGYHHVSVVGIYNNYYMARVCEPLHPELLADEPEHLAIVERTDATSPSDHVGRHIAIFDEIWDVQSLDVFKMKKYYERVLDTYPSARLNWIGKNIENCFLSGIYWKVDIYVLILIAYAAMLVAKRRKGQHIGTMNLFLLLATGAFLAMNLALSGADWVRLMHPMLPALILMTMQPAGKAIDIIMAHGGQKYKPVIRNSLLTVEKWMGMMWMWFKAAWRWILNHAEIFLLAIVAMSYLVSMKMGVFWGGDTLSYRNAWVDNLSQGHIDAMRPPIYPLLIGLCMKIAPVGWENVLSDIHWCFYAASVLVLWRIMRKATTHRSLAFILTAIYGCYPYLAWFNQCIVSEAVSCALIIFTIGIVGRILRHRKWIDIVWLNILITILILTRPASMVVCATILTFFAFSWFVKSWRPIGWRLAVGCLLPAITFVGYSAEVERQIGVRTMTSITVFNEYCIARTHSEIFTDCLPADKALYDTICSYNRPPDIENTKLHFDVITEAWEMHTAWSLKGMHDYVNEIKAKHPEMRWRWLGQHIHDSIKEAKFWKVKYFYLEIFAFACLLLACAIKRLKVDAADMLLLIYCSGTVCMLMLFAQYDYTRLMLPTFSALLIMLARASNLIRLKKHS